MPQSESEKARREQLQIFALLVRRVPLMPPRRDIRRIFVVLSV